MSVGVRRVLVGYLGMKLDEEDSKWRPTVELCRSDEIAADELVLLYQAGHKKAETLARRVLADAREAARRDRDIELKTHPAPLTLRDPWNSSEVTSALVGYLGRLELLRSRAKEVVVSVTLGTPVIQASLFNLIRGGQLPGARVALYVAPDDKSREATISGRGEVRWIPTHLDDARVPAFARPEAGGTGWGFPSRSSEARQLEERIASVATFSRDPILILGKTGTGKTFWARRIWELKSAAGLIRGEFVPVNCATLRGELLLSTLFGHKKGAATGLTYDRVGELKRADLGLLFLDEIGELPLDVQAQLLKAIDEKEFAPVGSDTPVRSAFQLVAATNRPLAGLVATGAFREDLYARVKQWRFELPGLPQRREDIPQFVDNELAHRADVVEFGPGARDVFLAYAMASTTRWPGNLRDLAASVRRMSDVAMIEAHRPKSASGKSPTITQSIVEEEITRLATDWEPDGGSVGVVAPERVLRRHMGSRASTVSRFVAGGLAELLRICETSKTQAEAGRILFGARQNPSAQVANTLRRYGLSWDTVKSTARTGTAPSDAAV